MNRTGTGRSWPWGLLGALALIAACERSWGGHGETNGHAVCWRHTRQRVAKEAPGREILVFGDSLAKFGLIPSVLKQRTGRSAYNLAVVAGPAPASDFLLRRALASGARPAALVVDFSAGLLDKPPRAPGMDFTWADLLGVRESLELAATARDPDLFAATELGRVVPSYKDRYELRAGVLSALRGERTEPRFLPAAWQRNWNRNAGAQIVSGSEPHDLPPPGRTTPGDWRVRRVNEIYALRFLARAARLGIPVVWVLPPLSPMTQAHHEAQGIDGRYTAFVRAVHASFPNVTVVDARHAGFAVTHFIDRTHLNRDGALILSAGVGEVLRERLSGRPSVAWRTLPAAPARPDAAPVEDLADSALAVREQWRKARH